MYTQSLSRVYADDVTYTLGLLHPLPRKNDFWSQYGKFGCILGDIFVVVQLPALHTKRYNVVPLPIIFILFIRFK